MNVQLSNPAFALFALQRLTGGILALLLFIHIATIIYAVQDGLSAAEIVERVRGNLFWITFYGIFALNAVIHAAIGLRKILIEFVPVGRRLIDLAVAAYLIGALWLSFHAIEAIW